MSLQDRRTFLAALSGSALVLAGCRGTADGFPLGAAPDGRRRLARIGIQVYPVRALLKQDMRGALARLSRIGYKEVEFWGSFKETPAEVRRILDDNGLVSPSIHIGFPESLDGFAPTYAAAKVMGQQWITVTSFPPGPTATVDDWKRIAGSFNDAGARAKAAGFRFAFHNYGEEFKKIGDTLPMHVLLRETNPELVSFELDVHWAISGGGNVIDLLSSFPGRFPMVHVKDSSGPPKFTQTDVGAGTYPWARIFDATARAGVQHYFAEIDDSPDPMAFAKVSYDYLTHLEF
jgi:sugar phosphate isomerase/epimerase